MVFVLSIVKTLRDTKSLPPHGTHLMMEIVVPAQHLMLYLTTKETIYAKVKINAEETSNAKVISIAKERSNVKNQ